MAPSRIELDQEELLDRPPERAATAAGTRPATAAQVAAASAERTAVEGEHDGPEPPHVIVSPEGPRPPASPGGPGHRPVGGVHGLVVSGPPDRAADQPPSPPHPGPWAEAGRTGSSSPR